MNFVTYQNKRNIFHQLYKEILPLSQFPQDAIKNGRLHIVEGRRKKQHITGKWREYVFSKILSKVKYISTADAQAIENAVILEFQGAYDPHVFSELEPRVEYVQLTRLIKKHLPATRPDQQYVLLNQRECDNRYLIESDTKMPLQHFLSSALKERNISFNWCEFSKFTPHQQAMICSGAKIFISAHGAGLTNMIFTSDSCHIIEYNFRKHWYCDPVCDRHFSGDLPMEEKCEGTLTFRPWFHKADFHNLACLLNKSYTELAVESYEGFFNTNPICRERLYVNGQILLAEIEANISQMESEPTTPAVS